MTLSLLAILVGPTVMVSFEALLHGLSHSGHGPLDSIWRGAKGERSSGSNLLSPIGWHITADVLLGLAIFILISVLGKQGLLWGAVVGLIVGIIVAFYWIHVYAAFETSGKPVAALAGLSILQVTLASMAVTLVYWGV